MYVHVYVCVRLKSTCKLRKGLGLFASLFALQFSFRLSTLSSLYFRDFPYGSNFYSSCYCRQHTNLDLGTYSMSCA